MATSKDLLLAVLAMDSYNRGYNSGISGLGESGAKIGRATLVRESDTAAGSEAVRSNFYASAYELADGSKVISFRGTDQLMRSSGGLLERPLDATFRMAE